ncbi:MAG TPA: OmpA family protein [Kofleriaceae bacterium]|nr:OmpA family protein [Kofleriaceae bacterium]
MKALIIASLMALPGLALADTSSAPPRGPDFVAAAPSRSVDRSLAASSGTKPIGPLELVMFGFDSTALDPTALSQLDVIATWMKHHPDQNLVIEGHTDKVGPRSYNYDLGERRAMAVRDHLESWGISRDRIVTATFGERAAHHEESSNDRRVVVFASDKDRQTLAHDVLENTRAEQVAWTDRGTKLSVTK